MLFLVLSNVNLSQPINSLPTIGPAYQHRLTKLGIRTISDLLHYFPFRYEDLSAKKAIVEVASGETVTIVASVWQITKLRTRYGKTLIKARLNDVTGSIEAVWFNQDYLLTILKPNLKFSFSGKANFFGNKLTLTNPQFEEVRPDGQIHTGRLVPIYSQTAGVSSKWLRTKLNKVLESSLEVDDFLERETLEVEHLMGWSEALKQIHFPTSLSNAVSARRRLALNELISLQVQGLIIKQKTRLRQAKPISFDKLKMKQLLASLPFKLTSSQTKAIAAVSSDLAKKQAMNRLLQGEVGSGKTVVAAAAIYGCVEARFKAALMAPTEVLAAQHYQTLREIFGNSIKLKLKTGSYKSQVTDYDVLVGTHALLNENIAADKLNLVVIDEQQRFGVDQRSLLLSKGLNPHLLSLTATPIPRTLALTFYGQLDISTLEEVPSGRLAVKTYLVPGQKREKAYKFAAKLAGRGGQGFIVCPLIEPSETLDTVKSATTFFQELKNGVFASLKVGLLHGRLKAHEKSTVIQQFREGQIQILVSTAVVEVGIDIPNADFIIIEAAERFGLASLHQLRGRVGRGKKQSYCLLFESDNSANNQKRLKLLVRYSDGMKLSEMDLKTRGAGDLFGTLQHGQLDLKLADIADLGLIQQASKLSKNLLATKTDETKLYAQLGITDKLIKKTKLN